MKKFYKLNQYREMLKPLATLVLFFAFFMNAIAAVPGGGGSTTWYVATTGSNTTGNGSFANPYLTISFAIAHANPSDIIQVAAGTYVENLSVTKQLTINGPNAGIDPNTGTRVGEAVITTATNDAENGIIMNISSSGTIVNGLTFDGDNINIGGGLSMISADVNAGYCINGGSTLNNISIIYNVFKNVHYQGIYIGNGFGTSYVNNYIQNNKFQNMKEGIQTYALHADISNNVMTQVNRGISEHGINTPSTNFTSKIYNNTITLSDIWTSSDLSRFIGIWINYRRQSATPLTVSNNTINFSGTFNNPSLPTFGLEALSITDNDTLTFDNNTINGAGLCDVGLYSSGCQSQYVSIKNGNLYNIRGEGIYANNYDDIWHGQITDIVNISANNVNMTLTSSGIGALVNVSSLSSAIASVTLTNSTISGGTDGVKLQEGVSGKAYGTVNNNSITGQTGYAINATTIANTVAGTCNWYGTTSVASKINGNVTYIPYNVSAGGTCTGYPVVVTHSDNSTNGYSTIQAAINATSTVAGDVIKVYPGTYTETISITKAITLNGPNVGIAGNGTRGSEAKLLNSPISVNGTGTVIIDGLDIYQTNDYQDAVLLGGSTVATVQNCIIEKHGTTASNLSRGLTTSSGTGAKTITNNLFTGDYTGSSVYNKNTWQKAIYINGASSTVSITNNVFKYVRSSLNIDDFNANITVSGNTFDMSGTHIAFGGVSATDGQYTLGANNFKTTPDAIINLSNVATTFRLDITSSTYNGTAFSALNLTDQFTVELGMYHRDRTLGNSGGKASHGLVTYVTGNQHVIASVTTIQSANDYGTAGDIIYVSSGTYTENVVINKALTFNGANANVAYASRGTESKIVPTTAGNIPVTFSSDGVTFNGFELTAPSSPYALSTASLGRSYMTVKYNYIHDVGTSYTSNNVHSIQYNVANGVNTSNVTISNNTFNNINNTSNAHSGSAIGILQSTSASGSVSNLLIEYNTISNVYAKYNQPYPSGGRGAYGIIVNVGAGATATVISPIIRYNNISNLEGLWAHAIGLEGNTPGAALTYNVINNLTSHNSPLDATAVMVQQNTGTSISINNNSFTNVLYGVVNQTSNLIDGTCNWYGTTNSNNIAAMMPVNVNYVPYSTSSTVLNCLGIPPVLVKRSGVTISGYSTIQAAISATTTLTGDEIDVAAGTYNESISITKSVTINGAGANSTILNGNSTGENYYMVSIEADNVTVENLAITNPLYNSTADASGIVTANAGTKSNIHISHVKIHDMGILTRTGVSFGSYGINSGPVNNMEIDNCEIFNIGNNGDNSTNAFGILLWGNSSSETANNVNIHDNTIYNITHPTNSGGIDAGSDATAVTINHNTVTGPFTYYGGIRTSSGMDGYATITNNTVTNASSSCIILNSIYAQTVTGNTISGATTGIQVNSTCTTLPTITYNSITSCTTGLNSLVTTTINATCNWWGTVVASDVAAKISGNVNFLSFLVSSNLTTPDCSGVGPVTNVTHPASYMTIQAAVTAATSGDEIHVAAGIYREDLDITKSLKIYGANYGINPNNSGTPRVAESIIQPATSNPDVYSSTEEVNIYLESATSGSIIDGFTIDGDNPTLTSGLVVNGHDIDACEAIVAWNAISNVTIQNNIIKNNDYSAIDLDNNSTVATTGNIVTNNLFDNIMGAKYGKWGIGVLIYNNCYTHIFNNVMTQTRVGVQTGNFSLANPGSPSYLLIEGNTMNVSFKGIFHNLHYASASEIQHSNNTISAFSSGHESKWVGIEFASLQSVSSTSTNNTINGNGLTFSKLSRAYEMWNVTDINHPASIDGGSASGVDIGVFADNYEGYDSDGDGAYATVNNLTITPKTSGIGVRILDSPSSITHVNVQATVTNCTITGGVDGIKLEETSAGKANGTFNNNSITGVSGYAINATTIANTVDATCNWYGTTTATDIAAQISGTVTYIPYLVSNNLVTPICTGGPVIVTHTANNSTNAYATIQAAINATSTVNGDVINVAVGTYPENVVINKEITLLGAQANNTPTSGGRTGGESVINLTGGEIGIEIDANNVIVNGFEIVDQSFSIATNNFAVNGSSNHDVTISYNYIHSSVTDNGGIVIGLNVNGTPISTFTDYTVSHNLINISGSAAMAAIAPGADADYENLNISYNEITDPDGRAIFAGGEPSLIQFNNTVITYNIMHDFAHSAINIANLVNANVSHNTFTNVGEGAYLNMSGGSFTYNTISGCNSKGLELWGNDWGSTQYSNNVEVSHNNFTYNDNALVSHTSGLWLDADGVNSSTINVYDNSFIDAAAGSSTGCYAIGNDATSTLTTGCNWFGTAVQSEVATKISGLVVYAPYYISDGGACLGGPVQVSHNGTINGAYPTIQAGINAAVAGDEVLVSAGTYTEQVNVNKSITLTGAGSGTTNIVSPVPTTMTIYDAFGSKSPNPRYIGHRGANIPLVRIAASNVTFQGFHVDMNNYTFKNVLGSYGTNYSEGDGILVDHVETVLGTPDVFTGVIIQNNLVDHLVSDDYSSAIKALASATVSILSNTIYSDGESGINVAGVDMPVAEAFYPTATINSNVIHGGTIARSQGDNYFFGIGYWVGATGTADGNTIYNAPDANGAQLAVADWTTKPLTFSNNTITNEIGYGKGSAGAQSIFSTNLVLSNNTIENQLLAAEITYNPVMTITGNTINNCTDGFLVDNQTSGSITIHQNKFTNTAVGHYAVIVGGTANADSHTIYGTWTDQSTVTVNATLNYWGDASGPYQATTNVCGLGGTVSDNVTYAPWYTDATMSPTASGLAAGSIPTGSETICYNGDPSQINSTTSATGGGGVSYQWQKCTTSATGTYTDITGATLANYDPPSGLTQTTWYQRKATITGCSNYLTSDGVWQVIVNPLVAGGSVTTSNTTNTMHICYGSTSGTLTLGGQTGAVVKWQSSVSPNVWVDIPNTYTTYTSGALTQTTSFRAQVQSGAGCSIIPSNYSTIIVDPTSVGGSILTSNSTNAIHICNGSTSGVLTLSGYTGTIQKWQSSVYPFNLWNDITNTSATYTSGNLSQTTEYRAVITSGVCSSINSAIVTVNVDPTSVGGSIAGSAEVCASANSTVLTLSYYTGNVSKWQYSTDNWSTSTDVANTTNTLTATNLTTTTKYRAIVTSGVCSSTPSSDATITVDPVSVGGNVLTTSLNTSSTTVCASSNSTSLTLSGYYGTINKWQYSTNNGVSFTDIVNITNTYIASSLSQTTQYRAVIQSGVCNSVNSLVTIINVSPATIAGSVLTTTGGLNTIAVNNGSNSTPLTLSGNNGSVQSWEYSTNNTTWTTISNTATTYTPTNLTTSTYFRAQVHSGVCAASPSNATQITMTANSFSISGTVAYGNGAVTKLDGLKLTLIQNSTPLQFYTTTTTGLYSFTGLTSGTYDIVVSSNSGSGWLTWGGVNATDYALALRYVNGTPFVSPTKPVVYLAANVINPITTSLSSIDATDVAAIKSAYPAPSNGYTFFNSPKWVFASSTATPGQTGLTGISVTGNVTLNIHGLCAGDVDASYAVPSGNKAAPLPSLGLINRGSVAVAHEITIPVKAESDMEMGAISLILDYDATQMEITDITMPDLSNDSPYFGAANNELRIGWASLTPIKVTQGQTILLIHARAKSLVASKLQFTLDVNPLSEIANGECVVIKDAQLSIANIGENNSNDMLSVYPNPAKDVLNIEYLMENTGTFRVELYNVQGALVSVNENSNKLTGTYKDKLDIANLASGVYTLRIYTGNTVNNKKIIINK